MILVFLAGGIKCCILGSISPEKSAQTTHLTRQELILVYYFNFYFIFTVLPFLS